MELSPKPVTGLLLLPKSLFAIIPPTMLDWWQTGMAKVHPKEWMRPSLEFLEVSKDKPPLHRSQKLHPHLEESWIGR